MSSGELKQEELLKDAMKLAQKLPGMMGGKKGGNTNDGFDMSSMGDMINSMMGSMGQNTGKTQGGMPDMANMASMMANMMGGGKNIQQNAGQPKNSRQVVDQNSLKRIAKAKQLKQKLRKREQEKNNS